MGSIENPVNYNGNINRFSKVHVDTIYNYIFGQTITPSPTPPQSTKSAQRMGADFNLIKTQGDFVYMYMNTKHDINRIETMPLYEEYTT